MSTRSPLSKNDEAWNRLFQKHDILNRVNRDGVFRITAADIIEVREPRLAAKHDTEASRPAVFRDNHLSLLPVSRGEYVIARFDAYRAIPEPTEEQLASQAVELVIPKFAEPFLEAIPSSEASALSTAQATGMIDRLVDHYSSASRRDPRILGALNGRRGTGDFSFHIPLLDNGGEMLIRVENAQMEVDAGYVAENLVLIVEGKNSMPRDFIVRQLYYPFRSLNTENVEQDVLCVFLSVLNGHYVFDIYKFADPAHYASLTFLGRHIFTVRPAETREPLTRAEAVRVLRSQAVCPEPRVPFPQANSMERILSLVALLKDGPKTKEALAIEYGFDPRQSDYYGNAAIYLGFARRTVVRDVDGVPEPGFALTHAGLALVNESAPDNRMRRLLTAIGAHAPLAGIFALTLEDGNIPVDADIVAAMKAGGTKNIESPATWFRRASTLKRWMAWALANIRA